MLRHVIAPSRFYSQLPNDILRHPRLSAAAVRLLAWQLSLPLDAKESLSRTAERARIGKVAFQHAKRQLRAESYLHEWRHQREGGRWATIQLVTNVPLTPDEARTVALPSTPPTPPPVTPKAAPEPEPGPGPEPTAARAPAVRAPVVRAAPAPAATTSPLVAPTACVPAAGAPTGRPATAQPRKDPRANTPHPAAEALLLSLAAAAPHLTMPAHKARTWAPLAARWLELGLAAPELRRTLTTGLDRARSPLGALRWRLEHALPEARQSPPPHAPPPQPRVAAMRECAGSHTQPRLFTPQADETHCPRCRPTTPPAPTPTPTPTPTPGLDAFRQARRRMARR